MKTLMQEFRVNGKPLFAPDADMDMGFEDIDSADAGRSEDGYMHRIMVRHLVGKWTFSYDHVTEAEYQYIESLFPENSTFTFTHPKRTNSSELEDTECYRGKYSISWKNARTGEWRNYKFSIIEC